jgi:hypothetical protein
MLPGGEDEDFSQSHPVKFIWPIKKMEKNIVIES